MRHAGAHRKSLSSWGPQASTGSRGLGSLICVLSPGGGGALRYRGGPHPRYVFRGGCDLFLRPPHVRDFVKEGYFFVTRYEVWGQNSLTIHEIYAALTPSDSRSDWASEFSAAKHAEDCKI